MPALTDNSHIESRSRTQMRRISIFLLTVVVVAVTGMFFFSLAGVKHSDDSVLLHTDLTKFPAYVKEGFEPSYASIDDPDVTDWTAVLSPEHDSSIIMKYYFESNSSAFSLKPEIGNYTIYIPFEMDGEKINLMFRDENPVNPGLFLASIGDNWEIFINGESIRKNIHVDSDDEIVSHRCQRDINIPIKKQLLSEGRNHLVIHIIGATFSASTGLFYANPYYIGDFTETSSNSEGLLAISLCTVYIFLGLYHIVLYLLRKSDLYNIYYGLFSIVASIYLLSRTSAIYQISEDTAVTQRIEYCSLYLLLLMLALFLEIFNGRKISLITRIYGVICVVFILATISFSIYASDYLLLVWQVVGVVFLLYIIVREVIVSYFVNVRSEYRSLAGEGRSVSFIKLSFRNTIMTESGNLFLLLLLTLMTAVFDIIDALFIHTGLLLTKYSFILFSLLMAFLLARKYANKFDTQTQMNDYLESVVKERTTQLEEHVLIAEAASRAKSSFLSNMSHEIRTPIGAVIGMTNIGAEADEVERKDYAFSKIKEASEHLLALINDILDMSKIEAGKLELAPVAFDFRSMVQRIENIMHFKAEEKNQNLTFSIGEDVPAVLYGDDIRIAQVLANLIGNAAKFTPEDGSITVRCEYVGEEDDIACLKFLVSDTGIGITEEQQSNLFKSFQQADVSTSRSYGGTGLGLALSKQIVELMDGAIWVDSVYGEGSTFGFTVKLPLADAADVKTPDAANEELAQDELLGRTILLAEDVDVNREIVGALLEKSGVAIVEAVNGLEAVELFTASPDAYDLILMDVQMPILDGYKATMQIRALSTEKATTIPIIAMTANVFREDIEESLASGMNAHIGKPIVPEDLAAALRKYLSR